MQAIPPDLGTDAQGNPVELYVVNADQADGLTGPDSPEAQAYVQREIGAQFPRLQSKGAPQRRELRGRTIAIYAWSGTAPTGETVESRLYAAIEGKLVYFLFALGTGDRVERRGPILEAIVSSFGYSAPPKDERLTGYWRYTRSTSDPASGFSMSTDHHLRLDADGRAFFATQTAGGDANTSVITEDRGWTKRGQWRTEGKRLVVDWQDGGQLAVDYVCDGQSLMFKRSSGNQLYERVR
ncbi:MAG: hypothetical protein R3F62_12995 [Planctomycetota bacterium]